MQVPLQITFRGMQRSPAIETVTRDKARGLERFYGRITSCHVIIETPARHRHKGGVFRVSVALTVPGAEITASREPGRNAAHEDVRVAIRDAFAAATRQLEDHSRLRRGKVKTHAVPLHGRIVKLDPGQTFGFVETSDGLEVYFHRNAVLANGRQNLKVGDEVRLSIAKNESAKGPQATTLERVHKHRDVRPKRD